MMIKRLRVDPATGEKKEMTDEEYLVSLLENLDKVYEFEVNIDLTTGKGTIKLKKKVK